MDKNMERGFDPTLESIKEGLARKGYRITRQREAILRILLDHSDEHLTAENVYEMVKTEDPSIGLATVYRTLELLKDEEIINQLDFAEGCARYEYHDQPHHHHLVCMKCGRVVEFSDELLEQVEKAIAKEYGFEIVGHRLKFYGYCSECRAAGKS